MVMPTLPVSGAIHDRPSHSIMGIGYSLLVDSQQTNGNYELMKFVVPPGLGPPTHMHRNEDECYFILDGKFEIKLADELFTVGQGEYLHLPRNVAHGIRNIGENTGSFLCWVIPGNLGGFFEQFKKPWLANELDPPPLTQQDISKLMQAAKDFDLVLLAD